MAGRLTFFLVLRVESFQIQRSVQHLGIIQVCQHMSCKTIGLLDEEDALSGRSG